MYITCCKTFELAVIDMEIAEIVANFLAWCNSWNGDLFIAVITSDFGDILSLLLSLAIFSLDGIAF